MKYWVSFSETDGVYGVEVEQEDFAKALQEVAHLLRRKEQNRIKSIRIEIKGEKQNG